MIITITLNIQDIPLTRNTHTAAQKGISRTELIIRLYKIVMKDARDHIRSGKR